jgi:hypothetical protein
MSATNVGARFSPSVVLFCAAAICIVAIGVMGPRAIFGFALCSLVLVRFYWRVRNDWSITAVEIHAFSRRLSRMVYLLLYLVVGLTQLLAVALGQALSAPPRALQGYLACALAALVLIRAIEAACTHRKPPRTHLHSKSRSLA